jgi:hypothetical protein
MDGWMDATWSHFKGTNHRFLLSVIRTLQSSNCILLLTLPGTCSEFFLHVKRNTHIMAEGNISFHNSLFLDKARMKYVHVRECWTEHIRGLSSITRDNVATQYIVFPISRQFLCAASNQPEWMQLDVNYFVDFFIKLFISNQNYITFYEVICCCSVWRQDVYPKISPH